MIDKVLAPPDGSKRAGSAVEAAAQLVRPGGGTIDLPYDLTPLSWGGFVARARERAKEHLPGVHARPRRKDLCAESRLLRGETSRPIA
jgi:hypothetical protein